MRRGEIWRATLRPRVGSEPGYRRPVLIVQSDEFNRSRISTVLAVVLTSNLRLLDAPGNILLPKGATKLRRDSVASVSQVFTLDKTFLVKKVGRLSPERMKAVEDGLRLVMDLQSR